MKKITRLFGLGFLSVAALGSFTSCEKTGFKVGLLCLHGQSSTYDNNFITAFEKACKANNLSEKEYSIKTDVAEDYNRIYTAAKEWAEDGYSLVCADSFGHQYGMLPVATEYSDTEFCHATGTLAPTNRNVKNFHNAFASIYEGRFLAGIVAGYKISDDIDSGKYKRDEAVIGYVGAMPYAEVISGYTSFYLGVKYGIKAADPNKVDVANSLRMKVRYTSSWYDYKAEKEAAEALIKMDGCKLISQHADSMGAPIACKEHNIPNVCYNVETNQACPDTFLVASRINWFNYFNQSINKAKQKYDARQAGKTPEPASDIINDYCGTLDFETGVNSDVDFCRDEYGKIVYGKIVNKDAPNKVSEVANLLKSNALKVFDTSTFTLKENKNAKTVKDNDGKVYKVYETDSEGRLTEYYPDCIDLGDYLPDTINVVKKTKDQNNPITYVDESRIDDDEANSVRSAPYFALIIDGIDIIGQ